MIDQSAITIFISLFSLVVAGVSLGWNIYRDCVDKGKLTVRVSIADIYIPDIGKQPKVLSVRVTNVGKQPITVDGHGFSMKDKTTLMPKDTSEDFQKKRLEPGDYLSSTLSNDLLQTISESADSLNGFFVVDSQGKKWRASEKEFKDVLGFLAKLQASAGRIK